MRGFKTNVNDWPYVRRSFLECWAEPGFHRFWQVWNPGISYFAYRLYVILGGRKRWVLPTIGAFLGNALVHTIAVVPFAGRWSWMLYVTFGSFAILTILSRYLAPALRQNRWPLPFNVAVNVYFVILSFDLGFKADQFLVDACSASVPP